MAHRKWATTPMKTTTTKHTAKQNEGKTAEHSSHRYWFHRKNGFEKGVKIIVAPQHSILLVLNDAWANVPPNSLKYSLFFVFSLVKLVAYITTFQCIYSWAQLIYLEEKKDKKKETTISFYPGYILENCSYIQLVYSNRVRCNCSNTIFRWIIGNAADCMHGCHTMKWYRGQVTSILDQFHINWKTNQAKTHRCWLFPSRLQLFVSKCALFAAAFSLIHFRGYKFGRFGSENAIVNCRCHIES